MKRKTNADIIKENIGIIIMSVFFIIIGIILPFIKPIIEVEYYELSEKEITIDSVVKHFRGAYTIETTDGERYNISGNYDRSKIRDNLPNGTKAYIKYHKTNLFFWVTYVEEVVVEGNYIVQYNDDNKIDPRTFILAIPSVILGILGFIYVRWSIKHNRYIQENRDKRIIKKYGSLKDENLEE